MVKHSFILEVIFHEIINLQILLYRAKVTQYSLINILTTFPTNSQVALGVLMRESKAILNQLAYTSFMLLAHDKILCAKKSAATAAVEVSNALSVISDASHGQIQVIADNFRADISSQKGEQAFRVTQPNTNGTVNQPHSIKKNIKG